jgi:hypothetical protein
VECVPKNNGDGSPDASILCRASSSTAGSTGEPPLGHKPICLPFASAGQYREYVDDPAQYRQYLGAMLSQYPALFPQDMDQGFPLHDSDVSIEGEKALSRRQWGVPFDALA